jgi:hypothetical protein
MRQDTLTETNVRACPHLGSARKQSKYLIVVYLCVPLRVAKRISVLAYTHKHIKCFCEFTESTHPARSHDQLLAPDLTHVLHHV